MAPTPLRRTRIDDDTWKAFEQIAKDHGETAAGRLRRLVIEDVKENS